MGAEEILVSGGVAAVLAAVAGGGLKAFGVEVPLLATVQRQALAMIAGIALIALGLFAGGFGGKGADEVAGAGGSKEAPAQAPSGGGKAVEAAAPQQPAAGAAARIPPVTDLPYSSARAVLMRSGWTPISMGNPMHNDNVRGGNGPALIEKGYFEVRSCAGAGMAECAFAYRDETGRVLRVVTAGEGDDPTVTLAFVVDCAADPKPDECWAG